MPFDLQSQCRLKSLCIVDPMYLDAHRLLSMELPLLKHHTSTSLEHMPIASCLCLNHLAQES